MYMYVGTRASLVCAPCTDGVLPLPHIHVHTSHAYMYIRRRAPTAPLKTTRHRTLHTSRSVEAMEAALRWHLRQSVGCRLDLLVHREP